MLNIEHKSEVFMIVFSLLIMPHFGRIKVVGSHSYSSANCEKN